MPSVAVVIPTRNRAASLQHTLRHVAALDVPNDWRVELIVVDNGSVDETPEVASTGTLASTPARVIREPNPGASRARNRGAAESSGDVLMFLDDDFRPPTNWLVDLASPIIRGEAAATVSQLRMGEGRDRPWLSDADRGLLCTEQSIDPEQPFLVGGSMAISRKAFEEFNGFEIELGPGALGSGGEDLLLTSQLRTAGMLIELVPEVVAEHWYDVRGLTHSGLVARAAAEARSEAWLAHHWWGASDRLAGLKAIVLRARSRLRLGSSTLPSVGSASMDGVMARRIAWHSQMALEQRRPRKFKRS